MPRKATAPTTSKNIKQNALDNFLGSSSPPQPRKTAKRKATSSTPHRSRRKRAPAPLSDHDDSNVQSQAEGDGSQSGDVGAIHFEPQVEAAEDDEDASPRRPATQRPKRRLRRADSEEEGAAESSQEEMVGVPVVWKRKLAGKRKQVIVNDSEEEETPPRKRKLVKGIRPPSPEEDDMDLLDEVDEDKIIEPRLRTRDKKSAFQRNLEKLKRQLLYILLASFRVYILRIKGRKRREIITLESSASEESGDENVPFAHAKPDAGEVAGSSDQEAEDVAEDDEDNFIVEDGNAAVPELPAEFSMNTYQDLIHHFKIICQLFVHLAVQDVSDRRSAMEELLEKKYFSVPLQITRRKIDGMRDSLVTSSVWRPDFKNALETYPILETVRLDFAVPSCDACHLGGRMSTILGRLSGSPYDRVTFEPLEEHDSSDSDSDSDDEDEPRMKKEFHLGRFCAARTRVFHKFTHWEYSLFQDLLQEVDVLRNRTGPRNFVRVAYVGGKQPPDDLSDADGIMDWLDERGVINMEWQKIKEMMEAARNLDVRAKKGEDLDD